MYHKRANVQRLGETNRNGDSARFNAYAGILAAPKGEFMTDIAQESRFLTAYGKILARYHTHAKIAEIVGVNPATARAWYSRRKVSLRHVHKVARRFKHLGVAARDLNEGAL